MAKVTGPLMSLDASGTVGNTAVFSKWKGRNYVRLRVIPQNIRSAGQQLTRGFLGVIAKAAKAVLTAAKDGDNEFKGSKFFADTKTLIASSQSWIAVFQGNEHASVSADKIIFSGLSSVADLYETAAGNAGLADYITVGDTPVTYSAGFQLYILAKFAVGSLAYSGFGDGIDEATAPQLASFVEYAQLSFA
jgi:hypothetical protein